MIQLRRATAAVIGALAINPPEIVIKLKEDAELKARPNFEQSPSMINFPRSLWEPSIPTKASSLLGSKIVYFMALQVQNKTDPIRIMKVSH